jgi:predicted secreted protein with PEFG-CTERM motif
MLVALVAIVGTIGFASEAHAGHHEGDHANLPLTVHTDSATYGHADTITVTGHVANVIPGNVPITVTVMSPMASLVTIDQFNVASDGSFETTMSTAGNLWKYDGTYIIEVNYGSLDNNVKVELDGGVAVAEKKHMDHGDDTMHHDDVECGSSEVSIGGNCTSYDISGGHVISATINTNDNSVIINIHSDDDGTLTISPSTSTQKGIFMVLVDGEESDDAEINGNTVIVPFSAGTEQIEIIGTFVIPEFGTIAAMILAVAIISIVAISAKSRLSIVPRY